MKTGGYMVEALRYKLWMFGLPIYGSINALYDNEAVYKNTITPEYILKKNHNYIAYHRFRGALASKIIKVDKKVNEKKLYDLFTKIMTVSRRRFLLEKFTY